MQKSRVIVSLVAAGLLAAPSLAQDRAPRTEKVQGVSFHVVSTVPASGYNQVTLDGQSYFVAPQSLISADKISSVQSDASSLVLSGTFPSTKANQVGILVDGQLVTIGSLAIQGGQATISGLQSNQAARISSLLSRKAGSPTGAAFTVVSAGTANGEYVFDVYLQKATGVRTYQVKLEAVGGSSGSLQMTDVRIDKQRADYIFTGNEAIDAADHGGSRLGGTLFSGSVNVEGPVYLGTWQFRPSADAAGTFQINVVTGTDSFISDAKNDFMPVSEVGTTVQIGSKGRLSD